jgi:hypothetical protein
MPAKKRNQPRNSPPPPNSGSITIQSARQQLNIVVDLIPRGHTNRPGTPLNATKITIHNTDNDSPGADARAHSQYQKGGDAQQRQVSWHFTVDDRSVYQSLPVNEVGWHAGNRKGNHQSIGIEICENRGIDQEAANTRAALLTALQLHELDIPLGNIVQHHSWTGKNCPRLLLRDDESGWKNFLQTVEKTYNRFDQNGHENDHPMVAFAEGVFAVRSLAGELAVRTAAASDLTLSWEDALHPARTGWSQQLIASVQQYKESLDRGNPDEFGTGYSALSPTGQIKFWCELLIAMAKFESGWNPNDVYLEADGQNSVGLLQLSIGDQRNYHLTPSIQSERELKDPLVNIEWAVPILAHWTARDGIIATGVPNHNLGGARYWSVLRGGSRHHYLEIKALTKHHSGLG